MFLICGAETQEINCKQYQNVLIKQRERECYRFCFQILSLSIHQLLIAGAFTSVQKSPPDIHPPPSHLKVQQSANCLIWRNFNVNTRREGTELNKRHLLYVLCTITVRFRSSTCPLHCRSYQPEHRFDRRLTKFGNRGCSFCFPVN